MYRGKNRMRLEICRASDTKARERLFKFWYELEGNDLSRQYEWLNDNPAGTPIVFIAKDGDRDDCFGCVAAYPRQFSVHGVKVLACIARDFRVGEGHRVFWPAVKLQRELLSLIDQGDIDLMYAYPNENAAPLMERVGFKYLGSYEWRVKVVRTGAYLHEMRFCRHFAWVLSRLFDVVLKATAFETWHRASGGFICHEEDGCDEDVDRLWARSKAEVTVAGNRGAAYLNWKYFAHPDGGYRMYVIRKPKGAELLGYIIYGMDGHSVSISDFVLPADRKARRVLMAHFLRHVRRMSPPSVRVGFLANKRLTDTFKEFGFLKVKCHRTLYYYCSKRVSGQSPGLENPQNWLIQDGDVHY